MSDPHLFWTIFAAVLGANILTGTFFWAAIVYSRMERDGTENTKKGNGVFVGMMMPLLFLTGGLLIALDSVPGWLNAALQ